VDPLEPNAALQALQAVARRSAAARHLQGEVEQALLQSVVDAAVTLFDAEASSIALHERDPDRLEFRVAAGEHGSGVIGLSVAPSQGIVGYVFSTGQAIALSDVMSDPRFDKGTAQRTGYVPRSIAAVPLIDGGSPVGVLQVLDKRSTPTFSLRDMDLLAVFARQAAAAIEATRVQRDTAQLLRVVMREVGDGELTEEQVEGLVGAATASLDRDEEDPFWRLVDVVSRLRGMSDREVTLVTDILEVVARSATRGRRRG
jgi:GAF domain-containing protein